MQDPGQYTGGKLGEYGYSARATGEGDRSFAEVVKDIIADIQGMIRSEVRLAKAEVREDLGKAAQAAGMLVAGGVMAFFAVGFVLLSVMYFLTTFLPVAASALIVGLLLGGGAALALAAGKKRFQGVHAMPEKTIDNVKENVEWMKNQTRS